MWIWVIFFGALVIAGDTPGWLGVVYRRAFNWQFLGAYTSGKQTTAKTDGVAVWGGARCSRSTALSTSRAVSSSGDAATSADGVIDQRASASGSPSSTIAFCLG